MSCSPGQLRSTHLQGPGAWGVRTILALISPALWVFEQGQRWVLWSEFSRTVREQRGGSTSRHQECARGESLEEGSRAQSLSPSLPASTRLVNCQKGF